MAAALSRRYVKRYVANFSALIGLGAAVLMWCATLTSWLDSIGRFIAISGLLTWLAFVIKIVDEPIQKDFREWVERSLLKRPWVWAWCLGALVLFVTVTSFRGAMQVDNVQGGDYSVRVYSSKDPGIKEGDRIGSGGSERYTRWVCPWGAKLKVKVAGLPVTEVRGRPWWLTGSPERLVLPASFVRPLVLVGADGVTVINAKTSEMQLEILVNGNVVGPEPYDGRAVWVGGSAEDTDLPVPAAAAALSGWKEVLGNAPALLSLLPARPSKYAEALKPGQCVQARLAKDGKILYQTAVAIVPQPGDPGAAIQYLMLVNKP